MSTKNEDNLREIERRIASAIIFSSEGKILMGRKDPAKGGVYADAWHILGGGVEAGETLEEAAVREVGQEAVGLDLSNCSLVRVPDVGTGETTKILESGEKVWCKMEFNRFEVHLDKNADELALVLKPGDDLVELQWFSREELSNVKQIPGGVEFFVESGYMDAKSS